jgi:alpha-glucoside transport system permease protein
MRLDRLTGRSLIHLFLFTLIIVWILPSLGLLVTSVRATSAAAQSGWWTVFAQPFDLTQYSLNNYIKVVADRGMGRAFINSVIVTVPAVILPLVIASLAGFAFAWMHVPGKRWLLPAFVGLLVVPPQMAFIPVLRIFNVVGLTGSYPAVWLAHTAFALPLMVYLIHNFIAEIPTDIIDSASIDGATTFQVYAFIVLPLSLAAIASLFIFQFIWVWNNLLLALIFLGGASDVAPMTVRIASLVGVRGEGWEILTAAAFVSMILPLIIFFGLQRYFVRGMLAGSVKG